MDHWVLDCLRCVAGCYSSKRHLDLAQKDHLIQELDWLGLELTHGVGEQLAEKAPPKDSLRGLNTERAQEFGTANYPLSVVAVEDIGQLTILTRACRSSHTEPVPLAGHKYVRLVFYYIPTGDRQCKSSPLAQHLR